MSAWRRFRALPPAERRLVVSAALTLLRARILLWSLPFSVIHRRLDARSAAVRGPDGAAERIGWAVAAVSRRLPGMTCLVQSLAAYELLRRAGHAPALHIGVRAVRRGPREARGGVAAHAWVECAGRVVAGEVDDLVEYRVLAPVAPPVACAARGGVTGARAPLADGLAALLRDGRVPWTALAAEAREVLEFCREEDLTGLVYRRLARSPGDWPAEVVAALKTAARAAVVQEELRRAETAAVLDVLAAAGVVPILFKGTALAYGAYEEPGLRPRSDTDLMIREGQRDAVRRILAARGYAATNTTEPVHRQFEMAKRDALGVVHAFDFHWRISTQSAFADLLAYEDLAGEAVAVPALGRQARAAGPVHALLLACVHPVMHHRGAERLIWLHDVHLLASRLAPPAFERFAELAVRKGVATICGHELARARSCFGTAVPEPVTRALAAPRAPEPSASYLGPGRRWADEVWSDLGGLRWSERVRLLREIAFPAPAYMFRSYGLAAGGAARAPGLARALLPALYVHRGVQGVWKVLRKRK